MKNILSANKVALVRLILFLVALTILGTVVYQQYGLQKEVQDLKMRVGEVNRKLAVTPTPTLRLTVTPTSYLRSLKLNPTK